MSPETAIKARVERMLAGAGMLHDVDLVFADLRFLPNCPPEVADLAHFAAHRHERDRGVAIDTSNRLLAGLGSYLAGTSPSWSAATQYSDGNAVTALRDFLLAIGIFGSRKLQNIESLRPAIASYALTSMHGCTLTRSKTPIATLAIRAGSEGTLEIGCTAAMPTRSDMSVNLCIFSTALGLDAAEGRLRSDLPPSDPAVTVERTSAGRLRYLE